jgi:tetratricopeptide (TPR) repeat protein/tRNA A-37 threonylcarbamoyl transferase component Bud32
MIACPTSEILRDLLQGDLPTDSASSIRLHLETCSSCLDILDRLTDDPELDRWMTSGLSAATNSTGDAAPHRTPSSRATGTLSFLGPPTRTGDLGTLGPYDIEAEIGRGGMGVVYRASDRTLGRIVALKVLRHDVDDERVRQRFAREVRAAARVEHDYLVRVYATSDPGDSVLYFAMEYIAGGSLALRIRKQARLDPREAAEVVAQAAEGLAAAHDADLVHRDIKPDNILLDLTHGRAKVGDFGLARLAVEASELTRDGVIAGTAAYLSPEQARGDRNAGPLADVYALGATLYECLAGEVPFRGVPHQVIQQILNDEPRSPRSLNDMVPRDLETVCLKAMSKEPYRRYASAQALADDLNRYLRGEPVLARPTGAATKLWRFVRRNPLAASLTVGFVSALLGGSITSTIFWRRAEANAALALARGTDAEQNFRKARDAVDKLYLKFYSGGVLNKPGLETVRAEISREILQYYREFLREHADDVNLRADITDAALRVGYLTIDVGDKRDALEALDQARRLLETSVSEHPENRIQRRELGRCNDQIGFMLQQLGQSKEAAVAHRRAGEVYRGLIATEPDDPFWRRLLGHALGNLANSHSFGGEKVEALTAYQQAREQFDRLLQLDPKNLGYLSDLAMTLNNMSMLMESGESSLDVVREALTLRDAIFKATPNDAYAKRNAARTRFNLSIALHSLGHLEESLKGFDSSIVSLRELYTMNPADITRCRELAAALQEQAKTLSDLKRWNEASVSVTESIKLHVAARKVDPADAPSRSHLIDAYYVSADLHTKLGHRDKALEAWRTTLPLLEDFAKSRNNAPDTLREIAKVQKLIADLLAPASP